MNQIKMKVFVLVSILVFSFSAIAQAVPPHLPDLVTGGDLWVVTFYMDNSPAHNIVPVEQVLCFVSDVVVGTHQQYFWYSLADPTLNGRATQEGDQIFMHGDYPDAGLQNVGHVSAEWEIVTENPGNMGTGHWKQWIENGAFGLTVAFANVVLVRTSSGPDGAVCPMPIEP